MSEIFERLESEVRSYCRSWPVVFERARGHQLVDTEGTHYVDFFSGAGALNYGHNPPELKQALLDYITSDGVTHGLDTSTTAKAAFLERFEEVVLEPRGLAYKVMFPGPTGTNAVEAALKLARKRTGRNSVVGFTNAFHGMTLGSLSVTGDSMKRQGAGVQLHNATNMPFDGYLGGEVDTIEYFAAFLGDGGSGVDVPAAVIVETVQAEGGINAASPEWLGRLAGLCQRYDILLIVDDIQAGCGRTGPFFSFEAMDIEPDIVCLSKSLSGYGLPLAVTLMKPEHDVFAPGEHNGTFRGNNHAFVTATAALDYWEDPAFSDRTEAKGATVAQALGDVADRHPDLEAEVRGRGLLRGLALPAEGNMAQKVSRAAFERGVLIETSGPDNEVVKLLPPLTIDDAALAAGLEVVAAAVDEVAGSPVAGDLVGAVAGNGTVPASRTAGEGVR